MKYMLLIDHDEKAWDKPSETERLQIFGENTQVNQQSSVWRKICSATYRPRAATFGARVYREIVEPESGHGIIEPVKGGRA